MIFTSILCTVTAGFFENAPIGWKIVLIILTTITTIMLLYKENQEEKLQDRVKTLENKVEELVGE